jgi:hypothetical protein
VIPRGGRWCEVLDRNGPGGWCYNTECPPRPVVEKAKPPHVKVTSRQSEWDCRDRCQADDRFRLGFIIWATAGTECRRTSRSTRLCLMEAHRRTGTIEENARGSPSVHAVVRQRGCQP